MRRKRRCIRQHTSAYVSIRQHTSAYVSIRQHTYRVVDGCEEEEEMDLIQQTESLSRSVTSAYISIQHTSASRHRACLVLLRQHTSAYVSIRQHTSASSRLRACLALLRLYTSAYSIRQHTSAYVSMRQHTYAYVSISQHPAD